MKVYVHSLQGKRDSNEDQHSIILNLDGSDKNMNSVNFLGVFDGHLILKNLLLKSLNKNSLKRFKNIKTIN